MDPKSDSNVTASYVMLQFSVFKNEIIESVRKEMRAVVTEELNKYREEVKEQLTELKSEQNKLWEDKIKELKESHKLKEEELEKRLDEQQVRNDSMFLKLEDMFSRIVEAEDRQRRLNVVVSNLPVNENLTCVENVENFFYRQTENS